MAYFPFFIDLEGQKVVVAGGGRVALRKVMALVEYGADVTVAAENCCEEFKEYLDKGKIQLIKMKFNYDSAAAGTEKEARHRQSLYRQLSVCMSGAKAAVLAMDNAGLNHAAAGWCRENGIPVNTVDQMEDCDFLFPALVHHGEVTVGITTGGKSPLLAARIRKEIEKGCPEFIGEAADWMGWVRQFVKPLKETEEKKKEIYGKMLEWLLEREADVGKEEVEKHLWEVIHA